MKVLHITTGDLKGIGLEVAVKALKDFKPQKGLRWVLWRSKQAPEEVLKPLYHQRFKTHTVPCSRLQGFFKAPKLSSPDYGVLDVTSPLPPTRWVGKAADFCLNHPHHALVTGPLSKSQIHKEGFKEKGHTELLKKLSKTKFVFMTFIGKYFNVVLLTDHIPLKKVQIHKQSLRQCIRLCLHFQKLSSFFSAKKKGALVGLNPHAGEGGLLGTGEQTMKQVLQPFQSRVTGPLVPDGAFLSPNQKKFSFFICPYHDQGLIPFKMRHEGDSFQFSLGLPFVRTSVSHGCGFDIFGQNRASPRSMKRALKAALHLLSKNPSQIK